MNRRLYSICKKSETLESLFFTINKAVWCGLFVHYLGRTYLHALLVTSARNHKMMLGNSTWFTIIPFKSLKRSFVFLHEWKSERGYCNMLLLSLLKFDIPKVPYWSKIKRNIILFELLIRYGISLYNRYIYLGFSQLQHFQSNTWNVSIVFPHQTLCVMVQKILFLRERI